MDNILELHHDLVAKTYRHGGYHAFKVNDPKPRDIHKASVRDRLLHHAIYRILYPYFDQKFIFDSYSCRQQKGTHRAGERLRAFVAKVSRNHTRTAWILKCDVRKFFASIDHGILTDILRKFIADSDVIDLLGRVIGSFHTADKPGVGLPLGNLTSQLLVNVYMNAFDQFMKRELKTRYYIRYADDFIIVHEDKQYVESLLKDVAAFLMLRLRLRLHPGKVHITTIASGVDFLGWIHFPHHRVLRTSTKRRMFQRLKAAASAESLATYLGMLSHGNARKLAVKVKQHGQR